MSVCRVPGCGRPGEGTHFHGSGLRCDCGERPNVVTNIELTGRTLKNGRHLRSVE